MSESKLLAGKSALVTGASSGLGAHFAVVLGEAGARVIIAARRVDRLKALSETLSQRGVDHFSLALDVNQTANLAPALNQCEAAGFPVDILVNNAGLNVPKAALEMTEDDFDQIMDTNSKAPFFLATEVARRLIARGAEGRIINIASVGAQNVLPGLTPYCMSKAAIAMMTRGLARELSRSNINVNGICPGYIETEINDFWWKTEAGQKQIKSWPRRRLGEASDLDGALLLLAGPASRGMTGTLITVDDGQYS